MTYLEAILLVFLALTNYFWFIEWRTRKQAEAKIASFRGGVSRVLKREFRKRLDPDLIKKAGQYIKEHPGTGFREALAAVDGD